MRTRKLMFLGACVLILMVVSGCRLNLIRLNKRLDRWHSLKEKASVENKVSFARKSLLFFLKTTDFQRGRESLVTEAERLRYHERMCDMQVFLIDYHAGRALSFLKKSEEDWERATAEW